MNIKNVFSSPAKKILSATGLLVLSLALGYSFYGGNDSSQLSGDLLNALPPDSIKSLPVSDSGAIKVWLSAGQGVSTDEQKNVLKWQDLSGNGNDVVAKAVNAPKLVQETDKGSFNFHPVLSFDGANDFMESVAKGAYGDEFFIVFRSTAGNLSANNPKPGQPVLQFDDPEVDNTKEISGLSIGDIVPNGYDYPNGELLTFATGSYRAGVFSASSSYPQIPLLAQVKNSGDLGTSLSLNGSSNVINGTSQQEPFHFIQNTPFFLGSNAGKNQFFKGEIAEVIITEGGVSDEEAKSIREYLGTKYGISVGVKNDYSLNRGKNVVFDSNQNPQYNLGIFGIGRYDSTGLKIGAKGSANRFSKSTQVDSLVRLGQANNLDDGEFVYLAHNNGDNKWSGKYTQEGAELLNRKWQIQQSSMHLQQADKEGVGSVVMSIKLNSDFEILKPEGEEIYALAFFDGENFTDSAKKYVFLNNKGIEGDTTSGDEEYSGIVDDLKGLKYFTLVKFGPTAPSFTFNSSEQSKEDPKKIKINATVKDLNKEDNIELRMEFETDSDGQCNGPWAQAALSGPISNSQGSAILLSADQQNQNQGFQVENISTQEGSQNEMSFAWNAQADVPEAFNGSKTSSECLRFFVRDQALDGVVSTATLAIKSDSEATQTATIKVSAQAPNELEKVGINISENIANNVQITNGGNQSFAVPVGKNYTVTCETPEGYILTTNPHPFPVNGILANSIQEITCDYIKDVNQEEPVVEEPVVEEPVVEEPVVEEPVVEEPVVEEPVPQAKEATLTVKVSGLASNGSIKVDISNSIANGLKVANDSEVNFTVEAGAAYNITCEEEVSDENGLKYFLLNVDNPTVIEEGVLSEGAKAIVTCEYAQGDPNEGTLEYEDKLAETIFETETACLEYDPKVRDLKFTDLTDLNALGAKEALILRDSYLLGGTPSGELKELNAQFPLSGAGSTVGGAGQVEAQVNLLEEVTRVDALKFIMTTFCIPILNSASLEGQQQRIDGQPMPIYEDGPRDGIVAKNIIDTASFLGIVEGRNYQGKFDSSLPNQIDWNAPVTKSELVKMVTNAKQLWQGYQDKPNFDLAKQYGFSTDQWFYPFYARAFKEDTQSPILQVPRVLQDTESAASRGEMIAYVFETLVNTGLYKDPSAVETAFSGLK